MSDNSEYEGKDLDEALHVAARASGIPQDELHYEIVEQGRRGLFGLGQKSVRIRVKPPLDGIDDDPEPRPKPRPKQKSKAKSKPKTDSAPGQSEGDKPKDGEGRPKGRRAGRRRNQRKRGASGRRRGDDGERRPAKPRRENFDEEPRPRAANVSEADGEAVQSTLQQIFDLMEVDLTAQVESLEAGVTLKLDGGDVKKLTGKDSELLSSLQFLLNRMSRRTWPEVGRINLSCDGKRQRRDDDLVELTREVAQQVSRTGETKKLHPMNAYERRLVHLTVREFSGLSSFSDGRGSLKRVRISKVKNVLET